MAWIFSIRTARPAGDDEVRGEVHVEVHERPCRGCLGSGLQVLEGGFREPGRQQEVRGGGKPAQARRPRVDHPARGADRAGRERRGVRFLRGAGVPRDDDVGDPVAIAVGRARIRRAVGVGVERLARGIDEKIANLPLTLAQM